MSLAQALAGGLKGFGDGLVATAKTIKEDALREQEKLEEERLAEEARQRNAEAFAAIYGVGSGSSGGSVPGMPPQERAYKAMEEHGGPTVTAAAEMSKNDPVNFWEYEKKYGLPSGYLRRTAELESSFGTDNDNDESSAGGPFQFIDSTAAEYGLTGRSRYEWEPATDAASRLGRDNFAKLRKALGRSPTGAELYLAHQQGGTGAVKLLRNPNARAADIVGEDAVRLNGGSLDMTAGEFANIWISKYNRGGSSGGGSTSAQPDVNELIRIMSDDRIAPAARKAAEAELKRISGKQGPPVKLTNHTWAPDENGREYRVGYNPETGEMEPILLNGKPIYKAVEGRTGEISISRPSVELFLEEEFGQVRSGRLPEGRPKTAAVIALMETKAAEYIAQGKPIPSDAVLFQEVMDDLAEVREEVEANPDPTEDEAAWYEDWFNAIFGFGKDAAAGLGDAISGNNASVAENADNRGNVRRSTQNPPSPPTPEVPFTGDGPGDGSNLPTDPETITTSLGSDASFARQIAAGLGKSKDKPIVISTRAQYDRLEDDMYYVSANDKDRKVRKKGNKLN